MIGVHTPEFEFEKDVENVRRAVEAMGIDVSRRDRQRLRGLARVPATTRGRRSISSTRRDASATTTSARATYEAAERTIQQLLAEAGHDGVVARPRLGRRRTASKPRPTGRA